jgi:addiction module RelB/DinJ family antitoxin
MAKTTINIKADAEVKKKAQKVAKDLGMPLSVVINAYLRQFIRTKSVHFTTEGTLKPTVKRRLDRLAREARARKNLSPGFTNARDMDAYLDSLI